MLSVDHIHFSYQPELPVLTDITFRLVPGEHLSVIGQSGSGKSTLLKLLHGEYDLAKGRIFWKDRPILGPKFNLLPGFDFMKYVSQDLDLMPFTTVSENIGHFLWSTEPEHKARRIEELLALFELNDFATAKVKLLSGGQKQRVALAKALAIMPKILLLDEPFGHIDAFQKQVLRHRLFVHLKKENIACIVATHDAEDVLGYADKLMVLHQGKALAYDHPETLYREPEHPLTASFFGLYNQINNNLVYAHQVKIVTQSDTMALVIQSYFKGEQYLIECSLNGKTVWAYHPEKIPAGTRVFLDFPAG